MTSMECDERVKSMEPVEIVILDEQRDRRAETLALVHEEPTSGLMTREQLDELVAFLEGPNGCDFRMSDPDDIKTLRWTCDGTLAKTERWLHAHGLDVRRNTIRLQELGGHCDCEVLWNAAGRW